MARAGTLLLFCIVLVCVGAEDFRKRKISNGYVGVVLILALLCAFTIPRISPVSRIFGMLAVSVPMAFLALLRPGSFGGGDVKFCFACGAFLGCRLTVKGAAISVALAAVYSLWLLIIRKNRHARFAFGPFLSAGFLAAAAELFSLL